MEFGLWDTCCRRGTGPGHTDGTPGQGVGGYAARPVEGRGCHSTVVTKDDHAPGTTSTSRTMGLRWTEVGRSDTW